MRFFLTAAACRIKLSLNAPLAAAVLLFVIFSQLVVFAFGGRQALVMNVGLFCPATPYAAALAGDYERYAAGTAHVVRYDNLERMKRDVAGGRLECAYALPGQYAEGGTIELYVAPGTVGATISNVLMASAYMRGMAGGLGYKVLKNYVDEPKEEMTAGLEAKNREYLAEGAAMEVEYSAINGGSAGGGAEGQGNGLRRAMGGASALFSWLLTMMLCLGLVKERKSSVAMRLALAGGAGVYASANIFAAFLLNMLFFSAAVASGFAPLHSAAAYALFVSAACVCLAGAVKSESLFLGLTVITFLAFAVLGGVFVDAGGLVPQLDMTKYMFPTYYYMESLRGPGGSAVLAAAAAVLIGAVLAVKKRSFV